MKIGEIARSSGLSVETVRYYEKQGLLPRAPRRRSGYREFTDDAVRRLQFIHRAKDLGFTLREIRDLLSLRVERGNTCADVRRRASAKLEEVEARIIELRRVKVALARLVASCTGEGPNSDCPFLDALGADGLGGSGEA